MYEYFIDARNGERGAMKQRLKLARIRNFSNENILKIKNFITLRNDRKLAHGAPFFAVHLIFYLGTRMYYTV